MPWDAAIETASADELRDRQQTLFREMLARAARTSLFRPQIEALGLDVPRAALDRLTQFPGVRKADLREHYPYGLLTCPLEEVVEVHASSGTTGKPTVVGYTRRDLKMWGTAMARCLTAQGVGPADIIQNAFGYGLFTGGLGLHYGALEVGAAVIPVSGGRTDLQLTIAHDFGSTVLCCTPSFALYLAEAGEAAGHSLRDAKLRVGIFGAEAWSEHMRTLIQNRIGLKAFDLYGLSEIVGPGVAFECEVQEGLHINEDLFYPEVVDPETGVARPEGTEGELVLTSLGRDAVPLIRYHTGDLTTLSAGKCACGRTLRKMKRIIGRADDLLIVAGVNFYPSQVESLLLREPGLNGQYEIWLERRDNRDQIEVRFEVENGIYAAVGSRDQVAKRVAQVLRDHIGLRMRASVAEPGSLARSEGKAKRVFDNR